MPTFKTITLGCKVNQYETQYVREGLESIGYRHVDEVAAADVCLVNTCTVTNTGDQKSRQIVRRLHRENPRAQIMVMGCYATRAPHEIRELPGVTEVLTDKRELPDLLQRWGVREPADGVSRAFGGRHRAYLKVQDGCLLRCSFCIIPQVRPPLSSRPLPAIVREAKRLIANGYRELVLTGIHLGHYGVDFNKGRPKRQWVRLATLVDCLAELDGDFRIRLSSIEATEAAKELLAAMGRHPRKVAPHLHISMQSGSDSVLARMRRRWGARRLLDRCRLFRDSFDDPAITTDVIVGFPGETETEFEETLSACRAAGFSKIHIFPFSARRGTPAATMPDQIPGDVKAARAQRLAELEAELRETYFRRLIGKRLTWLIEGPAEKPCDETGQPLWMGSTCRYAPLVAVEAGGWGLGAAGPGVVGKLVDITPTRMIDGRLIAYR